MITKLDLIAFTTHMKTLDWSVETNFFTTVKLTSTLLNANSAASVLPMLEDFYQIKKNVDLRKLLWN